MKYLASFHTTLKVSRYLFRALAVLLWLLIAFVSVFYIVNALHEREAEIHQELNLNADQAQRYIQRTADVMKELKYVAGNRLSAGVVYMFVQMDLALKLQLKLRCLNS